MTTTSTYLPTGPCFPDLTQWTWSCFSLSLLLASSGLLIGNLIMFFLVGICQNPQREDGQIVCNNHPHSFQLRFYADESRDSASANASQEPTLLDVPGGDYCQSYCWFQKTWRWDQAYQHHEYELCPNHWCISSIWFAFRCWTSIFCSSKILSCTCAVVIFNGNIGTPWYVDWSTIQMPPGASLKKNQ